MEQIRGYPDYYITGDGKVWSSKRGGRWLKQTLTPQGYPYVSLVKDGKATKHTVHKLVATYFINRPRNCDVVNHIDGDKQNNSVGNLEWTTYSGNGIHACRTLGKRFGTNKFKAKSEEIVKDIERGLTIEQVCEKWNISVSTFYRYRKGPRPFEGGSR